MAIYEPINAPVLGPSRPADVLSLVYHHRLLTTRQIHLMHRPDGSLRSAQRVMNGLRASGLAKCGRSAVTDEAVWYLTDEGASVAEPEPERGHVGTA